jgi:P4 family phage/plasmid primase-like protien
MPFDNSVDVQSRGANNPAQLHRGEDNMSKTNLKSTDKRANTEAGQVLKSDVQIAEAMARAHIAAKYSDGRIWHYRKNRWQPIQVSKLRQEAMAYDGDQTSLSKGRIDSIIACLEDMLDAPDFFDDRLLGINCAGGFVTFSAEGEPSISNGHDKEHRQRHILPGHWKVGTKGMPPKGSLLATFLDRAFAGDPEADDKVKLLQEIAGVTALGYARRMVSPKAVILLGRTAENGKSQYLDMLEGLLPPEAVSSVPPNRLGDDNKIMLLAGALLNVSGELSGAIASERFKSVITGDLLDARKAYGRNVVMFRAEAQHVYATNQLPPFTGGMDAGVRRRLIVVEFLRTIPREERIDHIGKRIARDEADLLLAWAVEGAQRVLQQGHFSEPESSKQVLADWTKTADPVLGWIEDMVLPPLAAVDGALPRVISADAFGNFRAWHLATEGQPTRLTQRTFTERLRGAALPGVKYIPGHHGFRGFEGLRLKDKTAEMLSYSAELARAGKLAS